MTAVDTLRGSAVSPGLRDPPCEVPRGRRIFCDDEWLTISRSLGLSDREFEIVQGIFDNEKELVIAEHLGISCHTVHTHVRRLYHKLDVRSRCELVVRVFAEYVILSSARSRRIGVAR